SSRRAARYAAMPVSVAVVIVAVVLRVLFRLEGRRLPFVARLLEHDLDRLLDLGQPGVAEARQVHAFLEELELPLEAELLRVDLRDDLFEACHGFLEGSLFLRAFRHHSSGFGFSAKRGPRSAWRPPSRTIALSSPSWSRTRIFSPLRTDSAERSGVC